MKQLLRKLRNYEIQIRKAITSQMQGDYRSVFKGTGLEFDDVRPYQYGDDIRTIDWNVTAKGHGTYVKTFKEEKEQTIHFIVDVSASQDIGEQGKTKEVMTKETCGVLTLAGAKENSHVGLIAWSDRREIFLKPAKGMEQAHQIISRLFRLQATSKKTDLTGAIKFALNSIKRRSVIILISDFIDEGYEHTLKALARRHDLVAIHVSDRRETSLPELGIIPVLEKETGRTLWVNSSFGGFRDLLSGSHEERAKALSALCRRHQINYLHIDTAEDFVPKLLRLFKVRNKTMKA
ncbi:MAG: DUF58 domain-containing protein [Bacteroidota bacterium]